MQLSEEIKAKLKTLPDKPGCYLMRDKNGKIIYVGKARSLRKRVRSYFRDSTLRSAPPKVRSLVNSIEDLDIIVVHNEAAAVLTEGKLIKAYRPHYNILLKDDKRFLMLRANPNDPLPRFTQRLILGRGEYEERCQLQWQGNDVHGVSPRGQSLPVFTGVRRGLPQLPDPNTWEDYPIVNIRDGVCGRAHRLSTPTRAALHRDGAPQCQALQAQHEQRKRRPLNGQQGPDLPVEESVRLQQDGSAS